MGELTRGQYKQLLATGKTDLLNQIMSGEVSLAEAGLEDKKIVVEPKPVVNRKVEVKPVEFKKKVLVDSKKSRGLVRKR